MTLRLPRSTPVRDALVAGAVTVVAELELLLVAQAVEGSLTGWLLVNLLILPGLTLRRSHPLAAAAIAAGSMAVQPLVGTAPVATGFLVLLAILLSLGWYAGPRRGLLGLSLVVAAGLLFDLTTDDFRWADLVVNVVLLVATWAAGRGLRVATDRRVEAEVTAQRAAQVAVEEERGRISRDLHDSLAHALTLITLQAGSARERATDALAADALATIEETGRTALADMHRFLRLLSAPAGEPPGLENLSDLVDGVRRSGVTVTLEVSTESLPVGVSTALYRVVQEGLTNVVRHSEARDAEVTVSRQARAVVARVACRGLPRRDPVRGSGRGLVGLRERLALYDGELDSGPTTDGWLLEARIPLPEPGS